MTDGGLACDDLLLCADATAGVGAGHVMRLLNLAESWTRSGAGRACLLGEVEVGFVRERIAALGLKRLEALPPGRTSDIMVVDSYSQETRAQYANAGQARLRVLVDDLGGAVPSGYHAVWNPNPYGSPALYPGLKGDVIAGPNVVPLRGDLPVWSGRGSGAIGLTFGGGTVPRRLADAAGALARMAASRGARLLVAGSWGSPGVARIPPSEAWSRFAECEVLITAGGTTVWEAASVGVPVVAVKTAENQRLVCEWVCEHGAPVVEGLQVGDAGRLAQALFGAIGRAVPLPRLLPGAARVAGILRSMIGHQLREDPR